MKHFAGHFHQAKFSAEWWFSFGPTTLNHICVVFEEIIGF